MSVIVYYFLFVVVVVDELKLVLCLVVVDLVIGGVLIEGLCGMVKLILVWGVVELLLVGEFVILLLGVSEECIVGSFDLDVVFGEGCVWFFLGVLVKVDGGVFYVDEVNLLLDYLVDLLFDVVVSGVNLVECDGIFYWYLVCFVLIGMMNLEEGELCL